MVDSAPKTLPARYYTDPDLFQKEVERFYFRSWICAGRAEQVPGPGSYFLRDVCGESIIITRDNDGVLRAFYNVCRHRGTRMCTALEGQFNAGDETVIFFPSHNSAVTILAVPGMDPEWSPG